MSDKLSKDQTQRIAELKTEIIFHTESVIAFLRNEVSKTQTLRHRRNARKKLINAEAALAIAQSAVTPEIGSSILSQTSGQEKLEDHGGTDLEPVPALPVLELLPPAPECLSQSPQLSANGE